MSTAGGGLDRQLLLAARGARRDPGELRRRVRAHLDAHDGYVALSGGKDSVAVLDLALLVEPAVPVVFFDSGLEFPETRSYLEQLQERLGFDLETIAADPPLLEVLARCGAWDHHAPDQLVPDLGRVLVDQPAQRAHLRHGPGELWGVRAAESRGRRISYAAGLRAEVGRCCGTGTCCASSADQRAAHGGVLRRMDGTVAYGPIWDWPDVDVWAYLAWRELPVNPVYARLRALGAPDRALRVSHLISSGQLEYGRATWLRRGWPGLFAELVAVLPRLREYV